MHITIVLESNIDQIENSYHLFKRSECLLLDLHAILY